MEEDNRERCPRLEELIQDLLEGVADSLLRGLGDGEKTEPPPIELYYTFRDNCGAYVTCLEFPFNFAPTEKDVEEWEKETESGLDPFDSRVCHVLRYLVAPDLRHLKKMVRQELGGRKFILSERIRRDADRVFPYFPNKVS
ncbi:MAG TPA: hypothetical protein PLE18_13995 [Candidatus Sumerlaeota bacterium]|nr:hypothetical protein [Candidatus Sumerlaeota bacterium]